MRTFLALAWLFTLFTGGYLLLFAPSFEMPDRLAPGCGWLLTPLLARVAGSALLLLAVAGWRMIRRARADALHTAPPHWHRVQFALVAGSFTLLLAVSAFAPYGPLTAWQGTAHCPQSSIANAWSEVTGRE